MRRVLILVLFVLLVLLTADTIRLKMQNSRTGNPPKEEGFWSKLIEEGHARRVRERKERQMATVSVIMALLALASTSCALYWCRRMRRNITHMEADILSPE